MMNIQQVAIEMLRKGPIDARELVQTLSDQLDVSHSDVKYAISLLLSVGKAKFNKDGLLELVDK